MHKDGFGKFVEMNVITVFYPIAVSTYFDYTRFNDSIFHNIVLTIRVPYTKNIMKVLEGMKLLLCIS